MANGLAQFQPFALDGVLFLSDAVFNVELYCIKCYKIKGWHNVFSRLKEVRILSG